MATGKILNGFDTKYLVLLTPDEGERMLFYMYQH